MDRPFIRHILAPREERALFWLCFFGILGSLLNYFGGESFAVPQQAGPQHQQVLALSQDKEVLVDIRTAGLEELMLLPGIGEKRAKDILARRSEKQFTNLGELLEIKGIGPKTLAKMLPQLVPFGEAPNLNALDTPAKTTETTKSKSKQPAVPKEQLTNVVNLNSATLQELCTLPGIGEVKAQAILDYRAQNGAFQSIDDITKVKGIGAKTLEKIRARLSI